MFQSLLLAGLAFAKSSGSGFLDGAPLAIVLCADSKKSDGITSADYVARLLNIPANLSVLCIIAIGYPDETKSPHPIEELEYESIQREKFGNDSVLQGENNV